VWTITETITESRKAEYIHLRATDGWMLNPSAFRRLCREYIAENKIDFRLTEEGWMALQEATEEFLGLLFEGMIAVL